MQKDKTELFETMPVPKAVLKLSIPTVIASLVMIIYNLCDTYFVGLLNDAVQTAGVTLAAPVMLAFNAVTNLFGTGTSSKMSRLLGEKKYEDVKKTSAFGFTSALIISLLFSTFCVIFNSPLLSLLGTDEITKNATKDYLFWTVICGAVPAITNVILANLVRAEGSTFHASVGTMSGCILNMILDPIFILPAGLNMGASGAGCATFISNCAACFYFFILLIKKHGKTYVSINPLRANCGFSIAKDIFYVGIPASIQNLLNVTGMTVLNNFTAAFNAAAVAAMGISHKISMLPVYVSMGMTQGIMPLISYNYASKNFKRMKKSFTFTIQIVILITFVLSAVMWIFSPEITKIFLDDADVVFYGSRFLRAMMYAIPFLAIDFTGVAVFQACGMGMTSFIFAVCRKIVLEIPALFILNILFPLFGLAYAQLVSEAVLAIAAIFVLRRIFTKKCV